MTVTPLAIDRRTLHDALVDRLREMIVSGTLEPGAKIQEQPLCEMFAVSRTPMREALRSLSAEGLVTHVPHRGATVAPITLRDLEHAFPVIAMLEGLAARLAAESMSDADIAEARALQERLEAHHAAGDLPGYYATNEAIHRLIWRAAGNPVLTRMIESLDARIRQARCQANLARARWADAIGEHRRILDELARRDGDAVEATMRHHLENKLVALRRTLGRQEAGGQTARADAGPKIAATRDRPAPGSDTARGDA